MLYISLRQYQYIVAVAELGSLTAASERLNVSQPSLSVAITRVEQILKQKIFARQKGAAITITPFGYRFVEKARLLLEQADMLETGGDVERPFVLGCFEGIAPWYLAPALKTLKSNCPTVGFQGVEGRFSDLASDVAQGRIDIAISYDVGFGGGFEQKTLAKVSPVAFLAVDHPLAGAASLDLQDLAEHPIIFFNEHLSESYMRTLFGKLRILPKVAHRATSLETMRSLAAHGGGIGISYSRPPGNISYDGKPLVTIPISTPDATADIVVFWSSLRAVDDAFRTIVQIIEGMG